MSLFSKIANFRCSKCAAHQPAFALLTTISGGALAQRLNNFSTCLSCQARLRLVARSGAAPRLTGTTTSLIAGICTFLAPSLMLFLLADVLPFPVLVIICVICLIITSYLVGALRARALNFFFNVEEL